MSSSAGLRLALSRGLALRAGSSSSILAANLRCGSALRLLPCGPYHHITTTAISASSSSRSFASAAINMDLLKTLRAQSGAPIVDCKKALQQTDADLDAALDWLREHGAAKASSKVQGRETVQGLVGLTISDDQKTAALVKVASETDFAGRSSKFVQLVLDVASATRQDSNCAVDEETVLAATKGDKTVKDLLDEAIVAIRENLSIASATKLQTDDDNSILVGYVHNKVDASDAGTAAAVVEVASSKGDDVDMETLASTGKKLAMHIVAARPLYLSPDDVPAEEVAKEKEILTKQLEDSGKPAEIVEKIVLGRLRKFYQGICLTEQAHMIEDSNPAVSKVLKERGIVVKRFETMTIG